MKLENIKNYLGAHISNWYTNARMDYGTSGHFLYATAEGNDLRITWEEDGKRFALVVAWWTEYTAEQLYNIWMEGDGAEEVPEEATTNKYSRYDTPTALKNLSLNKLIDLWEITAALDNADVPIVRGWLMYEIERRNPEGFDRWLEQDAPEDADLRKYVMEG